ncbi:hypothetical protein KUTeg_018167 [Tegillarca granosa]|uniref:Uncharacterized protein n=1 Tax=Tegillarca granosa TaxID=220873 RepID=A0ABQ9EH22_TEGGR|nr:hypothetical protein KUTeg_018167 [Tegillarca granosa]
MHRPKTSEGYDKNIRNSPDEPRPKKKKKVKKIKSDDVNSPSVIPEPYTSLAEDTSDLSLMYQNISQYNDVFQSNMSPVPGFIQASSPQYMTFQPQTPQMQPYQAHPQQFIQQVMPSSAHNVPPQLVTAISNDLRDIKQKLSKLESIETTVNKEEDRQNCIKTIKKFCIDVLKVNSDENKLEIDRAHRIGKRSRVQGSKPRPIVVKFHKFSEKEHVRQQSYMLKNSKFGISEQFPKEIADKRRQLMSVMKRERERGNTVKLVLDRLYINGSEYKGLKSRIPEQPMA